MYKIPYWITDLIAMRNENYYFVDKTRFLPKLEEAGKYLIYLRPRRFGKTLLLALLELYYSRQYKDDFEKYFKWLRIYENKTPLQGKYYVLKFDFSAVSITEVETYFIEHLRLKIQSFLKVYEKEIDIEYTWKPLIDLGRIIEYFKNNTDKKLMILIDEYDHFTNRLFLKDKDLYKDAVKNRNAFYREFFTLLKVGTSGNNAPIDRIFITGVTPMTMYDVTSGFNIVKNISLDSQFNALTGFTEGEVKKIFKDFGIEVDDKLMNLLHEWYDDYLFSNKAKERIYNSDMIWYFLDEYLKYEGEINYINLVDVNVKTNYKELLKFVIKDENKVNGNFEVVRGLINWEKIGIGQIERDFSAFEISNEEKFKSLMFYLWLATIKESGLKLSLWIPNQTIRVIDSEFLETILYYGEIFKFNISKFKEKLWDFALEGSLDVFKYLAEEIKKTSSIHDYISKEDHIKALYVAYISLSQFYIIKTEQELRKGFADLAILPFNPLVNYGALIEFKYIKRSEKLTNKKIEKLFDEAKEQLDEYYQDELVQYYVKEWKKIKKIITIWYWWELVKIEEI